MSAFKKKKKATRGTKKTKQKRQKTIEENDDDDNNNNSRGQFKKEKGENPTKNLAKTTATDFGTCFFVAANTLLAFTELLFSSAHVCAMSASSEAECTPDQLWLQSAVVQSTPFSNSTASSWAVLDPNSASVSPSDVSNLISPMTADLLVSVHHTLPSASTSTLTTPHTVREERQTEQTVSEWSMFLIEQPSSLSWMDVHDVVLPSDGYSHGTSSGSFTDSGSKGSGEGPWDMSCATRSLDRSFSLSCDGRCGGSAVRCAGSKFRDRSVFPCATAQRSSALFFAPCFSRGGGDARLSPCGPLLRPIRIPSLKKRIPSESGDETSPPSSFAAVPAYRPTDGWGESRAFLRGDGAEDFASDERGPCGNGGPEDRDVLFDLPLITSLFCCFVEHVVVGPDCDYTRLQKRLRHYRHGGDDGDAGRCSWSSVRRWFAGNVESLMESAIHGIVLFVL